MKKIFYSILLPFTLFTFVFAKPLSLNVNSDDLEVFVGQNIKINLYISPEADHPVATVSNSLIYDTDKLEFVRSDFATNWFALTEGVNTLTDTENGMIRRTAGFPKGTNTYTKYITYTFKAIKEGNAKISVEDGLAYDFENNDLGVRGREISIKIDPAEEVSEDAPAELGLEEDQYNILDIGLEVIGKTAVRAGEDYIFSVPLLDLAKDDYGDVEISVLDSSKNQVFSDKKSFGNSLDTKLSFSVPGYALRDGDYSIEVKTTYVNSGNIINSEKLIGVLSSERTWTDIHKYEIFCGFALLVLLAFIYHLYEDTLIIRRLKRGAKVHKK